jgi:hypothetical protein
MSCLEGVSLYSQHVFSLTDKYHKSGDGPSKYTIMLPFDNIVQFYKVSLNKVRILTFGNSGSLYCGIDCYRCWLHPKSCCELVFINLISKSYDGNEILYCALKNKTDVMNRETRIHLCVRHCVLCRVSTPFSFIANSLCRSLRNSAPGCRFAQILNGKK